MECRQPDLRVSGLWISCYTGEGVASDRVRQTRTIIHICSYQHESRASPVFSVDADASPEVVPSVHQLSDVQPTDWAAPALQALVERYGIPVDYAALALRLQYGVGQIFGMVLILEI